LKFVKTLSRNGVGALAPTLRVQAFRIAALRIVLASLDATLTPLLAVNLI
jgi:hypothetical protein